jgi:hypothetical protein
MDSLLPAQKPKRMDKDEQALVAQLARSFKISVAIDVYAWCELGERWSDRDDTSSNSFALIFVCHKFGVFLILYEF